MKSFKVNRKFVTILFISLFVLVFVASRGLISSKNSLIQESILSDSIQIQDGDIIFQTSLSEQSVAIQRATKSEYSHCGLIFKEGKNLYVYEAIQPVTKTPFEKWIARGKDGKYVIKRLKKANGILSNYTLTKMKNVCEGFLGKNYDLTFEWSDDKIYCSELVWKAYHRANNLEIGKLERFGDLDLTDELVKKILKKRYGNNIPLNDTVISPGSIFNSDLLKTIMSN